MTEDRLRGPLRADTSVSKLEHYEGGPRIVIIYDATGRQFAYVIEDMSELDSQGILMRNARSLVDLVNRSLASPGAPTEQIRCKCGSLKDEHGPNGIWHTFTPAEAPGDPTAPPKEEEK